ncbi:MAG: LamG-like jellyroll fold domain-containing protein [Flavobacteriia bacterium]
MLKSKLLFFLLISLLYGKLDAQPFGSYLKFDGVDDELSQWASSITPQNSDFTIEFWTKFCTDSGYVRQAIMGNSSNFELNFFRTPDQINYYQFCAMSSDNAWVCHQDHNYPADLDWHHVALMYQHSTDEFTYYFDGIDGTLSDQYDFNFTVNGLFYVGRSGYQTWTYGSFKGYIDELRISDTIRYNQAFIPPTTAFINDNRTTGLWHFSENNPVDTVFDASGNNHHFNASGFPVVMNFNNLILQEEDTLLAAGVFDSYQWLKCGDIVNPSTSITGATNSTYVLTENGVFALQVSDQQCVYTSECVDFEMYVADTIVDTTSNATFVKNNYLENFVVISNPVKDFLSIKNTKSEQLIISLFDLNGKLIRNIKSNEQLIQLDVSSLESGLYLLELNLRDTLFKQKIWKK